jgi:hypothetical protein
MFLVKDMAVQLLPPRTDVMVNHDAMLEGDETPDAHLQNTTASAIKRYIMAWTSAAPRQKTS